MLGFETAAAVTLAADRGDVYRLLGECRETEGYAEELAAAFKRSSFQMDGGGG